MLGDGILPPPPPLGGGGGMVGIRRDIHGVSENAKKEVWAV